MDTTALGAWQTLLEKQLQQPYFHDLCARVDAAYATGSVFPPKQALFAAFSATPPEKVKVVIFGQDPYHEPAQANGLAFSVRAGTRLPPSLRNIFRELSSDLGVAPPASGDLTGWAEQGVFLLNSVLSVEEGKANSHKDFGWQSFTDAVAAQISLLPQPVALLLWGAQAQKKADTAAASVYPRLVLQSAHPSPLSAHRGFFGSRPFSQINTFLEENGVCPIDWSR